jgi:hypothetical protein
MHQPSQTCRHRVPICLTIAFGLASTLSCVANAQSGLTLTLNEEAQTYTLSGSATGSVAADGFGSGEISWDNGAAFGGNRTTLLTSAAFSVTGNTLSGVDLWIEDTGVVLGSAVFGNAGNTTLTGNPSQTYNYSGYSGGVKSALVNLARSSGGGATVPTITGSSAFDILITSGFDPTPRGSLFVNVNAAAKQYYVSGSATGSVEPDSLSGGGEILWDNGATPGGNRTTLLTSAAFSVTGNTLSGVDVVIYDSGLVAGDAFFGVEVNTTLTGNPSQLYDYSGFASGVATQLELLASSGGRVGMASGGSTFTLQFVAVPEPRFGGWFVFGLAVAALVVTESRLVWARRCSARSLSRVIANLVSPRRMTRPSTIAVIAMPPVARPSTASAATP